VVPIYNEAARLDVFLASLTQQDYPSDRVEVLLIDGGSTDGTRERIGVFVAGRPGYRLVDNPKRIQASAFNAGVRAAQGDVIVRLDAHAMYPANYVKQCVDTLRQTGAAVVGGRWVIEPGGPGLVARAMAAFGRSRFGVGGSRLRVGGRAGPADTIPFGTFRREVFGQVGLMNELLVRGEDNEFYGRVRSAGQIVYFNPEIVSTYFARGTLRGFLSQMFGNGLYHILTLLINPLGCSVRHLVPFAFVLFLLTFSVAGFVWRPIWLVGAMILAVYLLADLAASVAVARKEGWRHLLVLPWLFPLVHITYGLGTLSGVFYFGLPRLFGKRPE
jgi:glycosyltransferase involved in cell wall biosynthesis